MERADYLKALGVAVGVLVLNLLLTTVAITVYSLVIEPGKPQAFYTEMAPIIGAWSGPAGGAAAMFLAGWVFGRRRPTRNGRVFMGVVFAVYLALDLVMGLAFYPIATVLTVRFAVSMALAGLAGQAGAALARYRPA